MATYDGHLRVKTVATYTDRAVVDIASIHRSTLVSTRHISEIHQDGGRCSVVVDGTELQVSRRHTRHLRGTLLRPRQGSDEG